jgi:hypothetical protein
VLQELSDRELAPRPLLSGQLHHPHHHSTELDPQPDVVETGDRILVLTAMGYACVELAQRGLLVPPYAGDGSARGGFSSRAPEDLRIAHHLGARPQGVHSEAGYSTVHRLEIVEGLLAERSIGVGSLAVDLYG